MVHVRQLNIAAPSSVTTGKTTISFNIPLLFEFLYTGYYASPFKINRPTGLRASSDKYHIYI